MSLRIAIVGCGKIADGHIEEIRKIPHLAEVVAVCDLEPLMAEQIATRFAIPAHYADFDELLEKENPDVVHVTTPPGSHLHLATRALDAGCHVYVEKPLTLNYPDSCSLVSQAVAANRKLTVGHTYLFDPPALAMRELIEDGVLGEPVHVESFYGYNLAGQFGSALMSDPNHWVHQLPGKLFQNNIDHLLNKLVEFLPDEKPKMSAFGSIRRNKRYGDIRDDMLDELRVTIHGEKVSAYATFSSHIVPAGHSCTVYGTKQTIHTDYLARTVTLAETTSLPSAVGRLVPAFGQAAQFAKQGAKNLRRYAKSDFHFFAGLNHLLRLFYESIANGTEEPIPHRDILRIAWMLDEVFAQAPQGTQTRELPSGPIEARA